MSLPHALTIAGSDSGGGAGIAADLATFAAHGVWGLVAITAVTAQDTLAVRGVEPIATDAVRGQIDAVARDIGIDATKTGMLWSAEQVGAVVRAAHDSPLGPLVVDPVLRASTGDALQSEGTLDVLRAELVPLARVVTPNLAEAAALAGGGALRDRAAMVACAQEILAQGCRAVVVTGGHLDDDVVADVLVETGRDALWFEGPRIVSTLTHGTGCVFSAALTARLASGAALVDAVGDAKRFTAAAIERGVDLSAGRGAVRPW